MKYVWLRRLVRIELLLIYLVILAGSVVRMTGSGMGCPDWPKCFGYMIPPTEEAQVLWTPDKTYQAGQMIVHDDAMYSANSTFTSGAEYNSANWTKYTKHDYAIFNPTHTWVEYINRLLGALSGIPMLLLLVLSLTEVTRKPVYVLFALTGLFLLGFEAWLGKEVVDGNLIPGQITYHMLGAFAIVMVLMLFLNQLRGGQLMPLPIHRGFLLLALILMLVQTVLGTQVREQVDELTKQFGDHSDREGWISRIDFMIYVHRSASLMVAGLVVYLWVRMRKAGRVFAFMNTTVAFVMLSTLTGAILFYFDLPKVLQPVHLLLSAGIVGSLMFGITLRERE